MQLLPSLLYAVIVTTEFDVEEHSNVLGAGKYNVHSLCGRVMQQLVDYFTPVFFTIPTGSHMECTETFARNWMSLAIEPAIQNGGIYKPFETLRKIQEVDWKALGLCDECCEEKHDEWEQEADNIWLKIQKWIDAELSKRL